MKKALLYSISVILSINICFTQSTLDRAVQTWAEVQSAPPQINVNWITHADATGYTIYRKAKDATSWGTAVATLGAAVTEYVDTDVVLDSLYEYRISKAGTVSGEGYIVSGIEVSPVHNKGTIILLVNERTAEDIGYEIQRLVNDLIGDGWKVIRHDVSKSATASAIKDIILADYNSNPANVKTVFCLGHVAVPFSGDIGPDGHAEHIGAWPADGYYGDMDGTWTDVTVSNSSSENTRNHNELGDGKFDQGTFPSEIELMVGRVDLTNMSAFSQDEETLIINYLNKDHGFRHKEITAQHRAVIDDNFGYFSGEAFASSGWKSFGPLVNPSNVSADDYRTTMNTGSYIWSYGCGAGHYTSCNGVTTTADLATDSLQGIFSCLFGSKFGDWEYFRGNDLLKAALCQGTILTSCWSGRPHWQFHHMGMGEDIAYSAKLCMNNSSLYHTGSSARSVSINLMGDPSLKMYIVAPPTECISELSGINVDLSWNSSSETVLGYYVYRSNKFNNNYTLLTSNYITDTTYSDVLSLASDTAYYMVRAVKLETTPSGSFYNLSQGALTNVNGKNCMPLKAEIEFIVDGSDVTFTSTSLGADSWDWDFGDSNSSTEENPSHSYADANSYFVWLTASNACYSETILSLVTTTTDADISLYSKTNSKYSIYPNPSNGKFCIKSNIKCNNTKVVIKDILGREIESVKWSEKSDIINISLKNKPTGIYFINIYNKETLNSVYQIIVK